MKQRFGNYQFDKYQSKYKQGQGKEFYSGWSRYEVIYDLCKPRQ